MMKNKLLLTLLFLFISTLLQPAWADDTEIFSSPPPVGGTFPNPNVLIILDNASNWDSNKQGWLDSLGKKIKQGEVELAVLDSVVANLPATVNVGLMMFTNAGPYIRFAVRPMTTANKTALRNVISGIALSESAASVDYAAGLFETFKYFGGYSNPANVRAAAGGSPAAGAPTDSTHYGPIATSSGGSADNRDCGGSTFNTAAGALAGNAFANCTATPRTYVTPISDACQRNYIVLIGNGIPTLNGGAGLLPDPYDSASINPPDQPSYGDEWSRFLYRTDVGSIAGQQNIVTYAIDVYKDKQDLAETALLKSMAAQGHGRYFTGTDSTLIQTALETIFNEVQAVSNVFASVTLPVSVNVRGTNLNQVYLGVFRPDRDSLPRWPGNLKEYKLALDTTLTDPVFLADSNNRKAESASTGFIVDDAVSYWTTSSTFWSFNPSGNPASSSDSPDGAVVEKGGVAQVLRTTYATDQTARKVLTCTGCTTSTKALSSTAGAATSFDDTNTSITQTALGAANATERTNIINWVRGMDNATNENANNSSTDIRASIHGDVLHSRPAVVNYNRYGNDNDVVAYYGSNDGLFRAVRGGQDSNGGVEKWAFIPEEFFSGFKRLRDNSPGISTSYPKTYFADGPVTVYSTTSNGLITSAKIFFTMRRGGRYIYALDVTDPDAPQFLWKKGCPNLGDNTGCSTGYNELGQTWSEPKVSVIKVGNVTTNVLIFGGGYDPTVQDQDPIPTSGSNVTDTKGRGIFIVDIANGNVIWQAGPSPVDATYNKTVAAMTYSIPSDIAALDSDTPSKDGFIDRLYVGDTGGNIWRVDISDASPANWTVNKLASLGYVASAVKADRRKFLYPPDVVHTSDANGSFDAVLVGSGDREHAFNGYGDLTHPAADAVTNRYYMIKDRDTGKVASQTTIVASDLYDTTANLIQEGTAAQISAAKASLLAARGSYITLITGEKVVGTSVTLASSTFFNTNRPTPPASGVCTGNLGEARQYAINFQDGSAVKDYNSSGGALTSTDRYLIHPGGGFPPSPVPVIVELGGKKYQVVISGTDVRTPPGAALENRLRTFWYQIVD